MLVYELDGTFIAQIGRKGSGEGEFNAPGRIAIDVSNEYIYVCDYCNHRVQIFCKDFDIKTNLDKELCIIHRTLSSQMMRYTF